MRATGGSRGPSLVRRERRSVRSLLPITTWLPAYGRRTFVSDLAAGLAVAALLIPESIGYAAVAGVPAQVGLYAALASALAYAVFGRTSILVVGPASAVSALSASLVAELGDGTGAVALTAAFAAVSGALLVVAGLLRLGWIVNFISRPVLEAFVAALCLSIVIGQLDGLLGIELGDGAPLVRLVDVLGDIGEWHLPTVVAGAGAIAAIWALERSAAPVPAAIVVVVAGIVLAVVLDADAGGVAVVGDIPEGLPQLTVPDLEGTHWYELLGGGFALLLVGFSEGYAAATSVAATTGERVDPDGELVGAGAANLASGFAGGLAVSGSISKSAAARAAGARTQVTNLTAAVVVLSTLLFLAPVFEDLPEAVVAAVVITAVVRSIRPRSIVALWSVNRADFWASAATFGLVLVWETLPAMAVGVGLSLLFLVRRASFPDVVEVVRREDGTFGVADDPVDPTGPVAVVRLEAPLLYANSARLATAVRTLVDDRPGLRVVVLDAEMWSDLDTSGVETLVDIDGTLAASGLELRLARLHQRGRRQLERSGIDGRFSGRQYPTIAAAVGVGEEDAGPS